MAELYAGASDATSLTLNETVLSESPTLETMIGLYAKKVIFDSATARRREKIKVAGESAVIHTPVLFALGYRASYMTQYLPNIENAF